jgi:hypothetical protein
MSETSFLIAALVFLALAIFVAVIGTLFNPSRKSLVPSGEQRMEAGRMYAAPPSACRRRLSDRVTLAAFATISAFSVMAIAARLIGVLS